MKIGQLTREYRERNNLSKIEFILKSNISANTLRRLEEDPFYVPSKAIISKVASAIDMTELELCLNIGIVKEDIERTLSEKEKECLIRFSRLSPMEQNRAIGYMDCMHEVGR